MNSFRYNNFIPRVCCFPFLWYLCIFGVYFIRVKRNVEILKASERRTGFWMDCRVFPASGDLWWAQLGAGGGRDSGGGAGGGGAGMGQIAGGFSHESEHDLAMMVSEFLESGSSGADSRCSSDSDSGFCDLAHLADKVSVSLFLSLSSVFPIFNVIFLIFFPRLIFGKC